MKIAIVAAGFTPAEADELRRSMATFKAEGTVTYFKEQLTTGMMKNGYSKEYAERVFKRSLRREIHVCRSGSASRSIHACTCWIIITDRRNDEAAAGQILHERGVLATQAGPAGQ